MCKDVDCGFESHEPHDSFIKLIFYLYFMFWSMIKKLVNMYISVLGFYKYIENIGGYFYINISKIIFLKKLIIIL